MKQVTHWDEPIIVFGQTQRSTHNDIDGEGHDNLKLCTKKVDFSRKLDVIPPEELPIEEWDSKIDFEAWIQERFGNYPDGTYYLFTRCITHYPLTREHKKKKGRPKYSYSSHGECTGKRLHLRYGKPFRRASGKWTCLAKFEIESYAVISVPEKREMRKYAPYNKPKYTIIKELEKRGNRGETEV